MDGVDASAERPTVDGVRAYAAGAGTGKTYEICEEITRAVTRPAEPVDPAAIIATTFTKAAAADLTDRVQERILSEPSLPWSERIGLVERMELAAVGTVHSVARQLLERYALRLGLSPRLRVLDAEGAKRHLAQVQARMSPEPWEELAEAAEPLSLDEPRKLARKLLAEKRSSRIGEEAFLEQMTASAERVCELLSPDGPDPDAPPPERLSEIAGRALDAIRALNDDTKTTADAVEKLRKLARIGTPTWKQVVEAGKISAGKTSGSNDCLDELREFSAAVRRMPGLHEDLRRFTRLLARRTLALEQAYSDYKRERGLLDFVDLEVLLLDALEREDVRRDLAESFELIFVDEFQDSSPIQLAIFLSLHRCVERSFWVGDEKQSIYAFRDADLELVRGAWALLDEDSVEPLDVSYRAHGGLVDVLNAIFVPVFGDDARIQADEGPLDGAAVERWFLDVGNRREERRALATGVRRLGEEGVPPGDVAILVRTNRYARELADVLEGAGIAAVVERPGLLATRECEAARAGLALVADRRDGVAAARILHLLGDFQEEMPSWLEPRLRAVQDDELRASVPWEDEPVLERVREIDGRMHSPSDLLRIVVQRLDLPERVARWGEPSRRSANLDALVSLAVRYEDEMREEAGGASLRGLLAWLEERESEEEDHFPLPRGLDAVTVSTCHSAKGLEWPVVILAELGKRYEPDMWAPETDGGRIEDGRPLDDRTLRSWIWPFGKSGWKGRSRVSGSGLNDDALASEEGQRESEKEREEAQRLLYVGMTRAEKKLILAHRGTPSDGPADTDWIDLVPHDDVLDVTLEEGVHELQGLRTSLRVRRLSGEDHAPERAMAMTRNRIVEWPGDDGPYPERFRSPSGLEPSDAVAAGVDVEILEEFEDLEEDVRVDDRWAALGSAVHAYLAGLPSLASAGAEARADAAGRVLEGWGVEDTLEPERLVERGEQFRRWVLERYPDARWYTEVPVLAPRGGGGQWRGTVDLLLVREDGSSVIVDHKIAPVPPAAWEEKAATYAGQLGAYREAVEAQGLEVEEIVVHLVLGGGVVAVG